MTLYSTSFIRSFAELIDANKPTDIPESHPNYPKIVIITSAGVFRGNTIITDKLDKNSDFMSNYIANFNEVVNENEDFKAINSGKSGSIFLKNVTELNTSAKFASLVIFTDEIVGVTFSGTLDLHD
jgi:hypothetical protein